MEKYCYVCGKKIGEKDFYYNIGTNSYICDNEKCYNFYFWDSFAAKAIHNRKHEYVIVDRKVYQIGNPQDKVKGMGGKHWSIQFNDEHYIETDSLWLLGDLPQRLLHDFPDNAKFIAH